MISARSPRWISAAVVVYVCPLSHESHSNMTNTHQQRFSICHRYMPCGLRRSVVQDGASPPRSVCVCVCCRPSYSERRFSPLGRASRGHKGGRPTHRRFLFFICFWFSTFLLRCSPFLFYREKGSALPFPRRPRSRMLCTHDKVALHCWVLCEKKPQITPRFEPATQPSEGYEVTN